MQTWTWTVLVPIISIQTLFFISKVGRLFAHLNFIMKKGQKNFLNILCKQKNTGQIKLGANIQKLEENIKSIKYQLMCLQNQF